jgi:hypothetical protein
MPGAEPGERLAPSGHGKALDGRGPVEGFHPLGSPDLAKRDPLSRRSPKGNGRETIIGRKPVTKVIEG